jgi:hypothetical protein
MVDFRRTLKGCDLGYTCGECRAATNCFALWRVSTSTPTMSARREEQARFAEPRCSPQPTSPSCLVWSGPSRIGRPSGTLIMKP